MRRRDRWLAVGVFLAALFALTLGSRTQGNTRDEGYYFDAAELYWSWYGELLENTLHLRPQASLQRGAVDRGFGYNHEHPALMKSLFGASWRLFHRCHCPSQPGRHPIRYTAPHRTLQLLDEETAMRLPTHLVTALMALFVFLLGAEAWSRAAGLLAATLSIAAPRLFFDAQLSCFDAPSAAFWVAVVYAYWRSLADRRWGWRTGLLLGLGAATKMNAFFVPVGLVAHALYLALRDRRPPPLRPFIYMATLGVVVFFVFWPWLWFDTVARLQEYAAFHLHHVYYNMEYLGKNYNRPPFPLSFPYVMMALTLPLTTLVLGIGGAATCLVDWWRRRTSGPHDARATGLLVFINALYPMMVLTLTRAPIFGATKHFHASIPFIALLSGYAIHRLGQGLEVATRRGATRWAWAGLVALLGAPAVAESWRAHPYSLSHYNLLAGGPAGGADLGMNRQFWGYSTRGVLPFIDRHAAPGGLVYWHDTNQAQLNMYVRTGHLRADINNTGLEEPGVKASQIALVIHERHFNKYEYWIWDFYQLTRPSLVLDDEGVPIVTVYERPR